MNRNWSGVAAVIILATPIVLAAPADADGNREHRRGHDIHGDDRGASFGLQHFVDPERLVRHMSKVLDLSEAQEENVSNIVDAARPEIDALREQALANFAALRELDPQSADYATALQNLAQENGRLASEATLLHGRFRAEIYAELTPEQREQIAERAAEMRQRFTERLSRRSPPTSGQ